MAYHFLMMGVFRLTVNLGKSAPSRQINTDQAEKNMP